ncbi:hypothetical protein [Azospirillum sp. TSO22-1]|uniref:hypothetical protein n=1 Tax=Azospirillum sp. TSO22-1 TaxID=716789 RepID=UPI000D61BD08|nr:hypothetical protein [Azospirillum sp. TSO22-1]PWC36942.1 hypothetical protein TSO221_28515 [Azospirillum sp. TSO22-1]
MIPTALPDAETYRHRFAAFYEELALVYPEVFVDGTRRIGSTFPIAGAGGLDAQTFYMKPILSLVFDDEVVVDLMALARAVQRQGALPDAPRRRLERVPNLRRLLMTATEAAMTLTVQVGRWESGTDLFANVLVNTEAILQISGLTAAVFSAEALEAEPDAGLMDQAAIDALFA